MNDVQYTLQCILYTVQCTLYIVYCTILYMHMRTVHYTVFTVYCTMSCYIFSHNTLKDQLPGVLHGVAVYHIRGIGLPKSRTRLSEPVWPRLHLSKPRPTSLRIPRPLLRLDRRVRIHSQTVETQAYIMLYYFQLFSLSFIFFISRFCFHFFGLFS